MAISHCGWVKGRKGCKQKKLVIIQKDAATGIERGICANHESMATAMAGWETIQEFRDY